MSAQKKATQVDVPSEDPKQQKPEAEKKKRENENKMSEEDLRIKEEVELLVTRAADKDAGLAKVATERLVELLRTSNSGSLAAVPPPLKHIRALFPELEAALQASQDANLTKRLHDLLSFISMTLESNNTGRPILEHKLKGTHDDLELWGHEYLRFLAGNIAEEWKERVAKEESADYLRVFVGQIVKYMLAHQDESTAIDLLMEIDDVNQILPLVEAGNYRRIGGYIDAISKYLTRPSDRVALRAVYDIYRKMGAYADAAVYALKLNEKDLVMELLKEPAEPEVRLQIALLCARQKLFLDLDDEEELMQDAIGNMRLSQLFRHAAQELDAMTPKTPQEVYKLPEDSDAAPRDQRSGLASAFVNGLANCGYGRDKLLSETSTSFFEQKEDRILSTVGALGLVHLWDHVEGLQKVDKYFYSDSAAVKAGACLACGVLMCGVKNPFDPALGLLLEQVTSGVKMVAIAATLGLGYAYAGTQKEDVKDVLVPILADCEQPLELQCMAAYALASVFVGSADEDITEVMMSCLMEIPLASLEEPCVRYLILALGCLFLCRQEAADTLLDATNTLPEVIRRYTEIVVRSCAFAATGNVVVIQSLFHVIAENKEPEVAAEKSDGSDKEGEGNEEAPEGAAAADGATGAPAEVKEEAKDVKTLNYKAAAVLGIGLVAVGEELGMEMSKRAIIHVLLADTVSKDKDAMSGRCAVPLVYALLSASNPNMPVVESLNRLAHDSDITTATNAALALGVVSAGSNNARVGTKLTSLAQYYGSDKHADTLFAVRLAQGLCAMGKGHLTLSCLQNDKGSISVTALMGVLGFLHNGLALKQTLLDKYHYMFYALTPAISPRMVLAVDAEMEPVKEVQVRVGLPVDTVAVPGNPKKITGFQTQKTPVLLNATDKVECADSSYVPVEDIVEGIFVVKKKPVETE